MKATANKHNALDKRSFFKGKSRKNSKSGMSLKVHNCQKWGLPIAV